MRAAEDANNSFQDVIGLLSPRAAAYPPHRCRRSAGSRIEIEVRSDAKATAAVLLSGGEKALAAGFPLRAPPRASHALHGLDEVDAPLDDANLGRFLRLLDSLRSRTQVVVSRTRSERWSDRTRSSA